MKHEEGAARPNVLFMFHVFRFHASAASADKEDRIAPPRRAYRTTKRESPMSDKAEKDKKPDAAPAKELEKKDEGEKKKGGMMAKTPVLLGGVMLLEAVVLFAGFKFLGGGAKGASAEVILAPEGKGEKGGPETKEKKTMIEVAVLDFKAPNTQNGRRFIYDISIVACVPPDFETKVKDGLKQQDARVKDRVRTIIATMDPDKLGGGSEPGLETLRRQVKKQLDDILGEGMIDEVLVPRCNPFRADF
jgi:flagellar basal body-associated protein FliL